MEKGVRVRAVEGRGSERWHEIGMGKEEGKGEGLKWRRKGWREREEETKGRKG